MKSMGRRFGVFALAGILLITLTAVQTVAAAEVQRYVMGSGPMGGPWKIGVGAGVQLINEQLKDKYFFTAAASGGSVENTRRLAAGEYDTIWIQGGNMYEVWTGTGLFAGKQPYTEMRMMEYLIDQALNIVVLAKSPIRTLSDLAGKKVNMGPAGSGWVDITKTMMKSLGIENKVKANYLNFEAGAQALKDGQIDATFSPGGPFATPAIVEIARSVPIRLLEPHPEEAKKIVAAIPYLHVGVIPANKAPGENSDRDRKAFCGAVYWVAQARMPEQVVYDLLKVTQEPTEQGTPRQGPQLLDDGRSEIRRDREIRDPPAPGGGTVLEGAGGKDPRGDAEITKRSGESVPTAAATQPVSPPRAPAPMESFSEREEAMNDKVVIISDCDVPMMNVQWGKTKILVGPGSEAQAPQFMMKITEYMPSHAHDWHDHPQDEVIFVLSGRGLTETAEGKREIVPGDMVYVPANVKHATYNTHVEPLRAIIIKSPPDKEPGH